MCVWGRGVCSVLSEHQWSYGVVELSSPPQHRLIGRESGAGCSHGGNRDTYWTGAAGEQVDLWGGRWHPALELSAGWGTVEFSLFLWYSVRVGTEVEKQKSEIAFGANYQPCTLTFCGSGCSQGRRWRYRGCWIPEERFHQHPPVNTQTHLINKKTDEGWE